MSLFKQLEKLYRPDRFQREDFLTEIVVQVLRNSQELTLEWLRSLGVTDLKNAYIKIDPQVVFGKLAGHDTDSRPDMAISLVEGGNTELILIESKVDSKQGGTQLQRYADHLAAEKERKALKKTSLVFITRDYEAATVALSAPDHSFNFKNTRWFEFYNKLKAHVKKNSDGLAEQLKLFMEENRMSLGNQFRSTDLVAMENYLSAKALMDETLNGEVSEKTKKIFGSVSNLKRNVDEQLRDHHRYVIYSGECVIGYWFPHENPDKPVWVGIELWSDPRSQARKEEIQAFRGWIKKSGGSWTGEQLDDETGWSGIRRGKAIQSLIGEEDHVRAIKNHLLQLLEEIGQFKKTYPNLSWATNAPEVDT
jgi:hypothetical protein